MADEPLIPVLQPEPESQPRQRTERAAHMTCEFCGCELVSKGDILTMSPKAKKYRELADENETLRAKIESLTASPAVPVPVPSMEPKKFSVV